MTIVERERVEVEAPAELSVYGEILMEAARVLRKEGWCQRYTRTVNGWCAVGAISHAACNLNMGHAFKTTMDKFGLYLQGCAHGVSMWNDAPERTKEEVIEAFERAALEV